MATDNQILRAAVRQVAEKLEAQRVQVGPDNEKGLDVAIELVLRASEDPEGHVYSGVRLAAMQLGALVGDVLAR